MAEHDLTRGALRWLTSIDAPARVLLACAHTPLGFVPADAAAIRLDGCVADTPIGLCAQLLACGVPRVGVLACPERPAQAAEQVAGWAAVLPDVTAASPEPEPKRRFRKAVPGPVYELGRPQVSRRFAFGLAAAQQLPLALAEEESQRVVAALRLLEEQDRARFARPDAAAAPRPEVHGASDGDPEPPAAAGPGPSAEASGPIVEEPAGGRAEPGSDAVALVASGCVACGVCVRACPHDALELVHDPDRSVLRQVPELCSGERACVQLCPHDALSVSGPLSLFDLARTPAVELAVVATAACRRCGARHPAAEGDLCPPCAFRSRNVFGHVPVQPHT